MYYKLGRYDQSVEMYTLALNQSPDACVYSNRCAAYLSLNRFDEALEDASNCIKLRPEWYKGYQRQGDC